MALGLPGLGELRVLEIVGAVVEVVAVAVDRDAVGLAVPGADRRLQVADIVVHLDLRGDPVGHLGGEALAADVALERRAHLEDVEIDRAGRDRLLQAGVVVGLREVDPADPGAGILLPGLEEAAEQEVVQVLVVEPHEGQLDALELALSDVGLGRVEAERADLLPVGVGRRAHADARDLQDLRAQVALRQRAQGQPAQSARRADAGGSLEKAPPCRPFEQPVVDFLLHCSHSPILVFDEAARRSRRVSSMRRPLRVSIRARYSSIARRVRMLSSAASTMRKLLTASSIQSDRSRSSRIALRKNACSRSHSS